MGMLRMEGVRFCRDNRRQKSQSTDVTDVLLSAANINVTEGEVRVIVGEGGSGKSSLIKILTGFAKPTAGRVKLMGRDLERLRASSLRRLRRRVAIIEELPTHLDDQSALSNVALALEIDGLSSELIHTRCAEALVTVGLGGRMEVRADRLSRSERLWLALARAIARRPSVVLADEPWRDLDELGRDRFCDLMDSLAANGAACLVTTGDHHVVELAELWNWSVSELRDGQIVPFHELSTLRRHEATHAVLLPSDPPSAPPSAPVSDDSFAGVFSFPTPAPLPVSVHREPSVPISARVGARVGVR